jgi:hypothetical protein
VRKPALGQEGTILMSAMTMAVAVSGWPLIVSFEGGAGSVTKFAGIDLLERVLS